MKCYEYIISQNKSWFTTYWKMLSWILFNYLHRKLAFLACELQSMVIVYSVDEETGILTQLQQVLFFQLEASFV